MALHLKNAI